jgi:energy-coupling factor transport system ATP-binding protein
MTARPSLLMEHFSYRYPFAERDAFNNISLELQSGETLGIVGPSASGKTSLLYAVAGILGKHFPAGKMSGKILRDAAQPVISPAEVGFVFQNQYMQLSGVTETVEAEIAFSLEQLGTPPEIIHERIAEQISQFRLKHLTRQHPQTLSSGETRMVALACEMAKHPRWLLLDQPTESLHAEGISLLINALDKFKQSTMLIVVEHRLELLNTLCDKVLFLLNGNQQFYSTPSELFLSGIDTHELDIPLWIDAQQKLIGNIETLSYRKSLRTLKQWHSSNLPK